MLVSSFNLHHVLPAMSLPICRVFEMGLTGVIIMEYAHVQARDGVQTSVAYERVSGAVLLSLSVFI